MKRTIAIIILCLCMAMTLGACKKEGDMVESMISTILPTEDKTDNAKDHTNNGTVTDSDGHIGNEDNNESSGADSIIPDESAEVYTETFETSVM